MFDIQKVIFICGPTASGKSAHATDLAREIGGEIVNGDAFQLYRGLEILSAAPSEQEKSLAPHHLYGALDPSAKNDAQAYVNLAAPVIAEIQSRGKIPIVTGGSGLYLKFLTHGASPLPTGDLEMRQQLDARPLEALVAELEKLDPEEAARTNLKNRRYVSRALEICLLSGQKASVLRDQWQSSTQKIESQLNGRLITLPRPTLHARIAKRTRMMLSGGALQEVERLQAASPTLEKAIGFREIRSLLAGEIQLDACEELINAATRQYAKRQETWFRRESWLTPVQA